MEKFGKFDEWLVKGFPTNLYLLMFLHSSKLCECFHLSKFFLKILYYMVCISISSAHAVLRIYLVEVYTINFHGNKA